MYNYQEEKPKIFIEENQKQFLKCRDIVAKLPDLFIMWEVLNKVGGDSWLLMAYVDRLVELGEIIEVKQSDYVAGQNRLFKKL